MLFHIAEAVFEDPDSVVRDVVFPVVNEQTIEQLVKEFRSSGPGYVNKVHTKIRASYAQHYRRMLPRILEALEFRSNNTAWRSILDAIDVIKLHPDRQERYFAVEDIPVDDIVRKNRIDGKGQVRSSSPSIQTGMSQGMNLLEQSLNDLVKDGTIDRDVALRFAEEKKQITG